MTFESMMTSDAFRHLDPNLQAKILEWHEFNNRKRLSQTAKWFDDPDLRKAWLKQLFGSFQYHEDLVRLHWPWVQYIEQAIERPYVREKFPVAYDFFKRIAIPNFEKVIRPGQLDPAKWVNGASGGAARSIAYYDHDTGLDMDHNWQWCTEDDRHFVFAIWGLMTKMSTNIQNTVDRTWFDKHVGNDDDLLQERYVGPIDWPPNWKQDLLGEHGLRLLRPEALRIKAGEPVPRSGAWRALDAGRSETRSVASGETLPDLGSAYGTTVWQLEDPL